MNNIVNNTTTKFIIFLVLSISSYVAAQNTEVVYQAKFTAVPNYDNLTDIAPSELERAKSISKQLANTVEKQIIRLVSDSNSFILTVEDQMGIDEEVISSKVGRSVLNLYSFVYSNNDEFSFGNDTDKSEIIKFNNESVSWKITSESKDILGFKCFKAIASYPSFSLEQKRGLPTIAWFSPELNRKGGPLVYSNLPGLILEVKSDAATITAMEISETKESVVFPKSDKDVVSFQDNYLSILKKSEAIKKRMKE